MSRHTQLRLISRTEDMGAHKSRSFLVAFRRPSSLVQHCSLPTCVPMVFRGLCVLAVPGLGKADQIPPTDVRHQCGDPAQHYTRRLCTALRGRVDSAKAEELLAGLGYAVAPAPTNNGGIGDRRRQNTDEAPDGNIEPSVRTKKALGGEVTCAFPSLCVLPSEPSSSRMRRARKLPDGVVGLRDRLKIPCSM